MPIAIEEGYAEFRGYQTWFRVTGDLQAKKTAGRHPPWRARRRPRLYRCLQAAGRISGRAVIQYDQLGCGRSTHLRDKGAGFLDRRGCSWTSWTTC